MPRRWTEGGTGSARNHRLRFECRISHLAAFFVLDNRESSTIITTTTTTTPRPYTASTGSRRQAGKTCRMLLEVVGAPLVASFSTAITPNCIDTGIGFVTGEHSTISRVLHQNLRPGGGLLGIAFSPPLRIT